MKTTVHLHRHTPAPPTQPTRPSTAVLGVLVSVFAAIGAVLFSLLTDLPAVAILIPVVIIGFTLSWHATGHTDDHDNAPPS